MENNRLGPTGQANPLVPLGPLGPADQPRLPGLQGPADPIRLPGPPEPADRPGPADPAGPPVQLRLPMPPFPIHINDVYGIAILNRGSLDPNPHIHLELGCYPLSEDRLRNLYSLVFDDEDEKQVYDKKRSYVHISGKYVLEQSEVQLLSDFELRTIKQLLALRDVECGVILYDQQTVCPSLPIIFHLKSAQFVRNYEYAMKCRGLKQVLVLCAEDMMKFWCESFYEYFPEARVRVFHPTVNPLLEAQDFLKKISASNFVEILITTHDKYNYNYVELNSVLWSCLIVDKAEMLRETPQGFKYIKEIPTPFRILTTYTSFEGDLISLHEYIEVCAPGWFTSNYDPMKIEETIATEISEENENGFTKTLIRQLVTEMEKIIIIRREDGYQGSDVMKYVEFFFDKKTQDFFKFLKDPGLNLGVCHWRDDTIAFRRPWYTALPGYNSQERYLCRKFVFDMKVEMAKAIYAQASPEMYENRDAMMSIFDLHLRKGIKLYHFNTVWEYLKDNNQGDHYIIRPEILPLILNIDK
ncbi:unnamed protein product [Caenorhabditis bovis]|uniref:SNF2 N-terminal domain-containing protein n=1 Tax=Caenorhabditis bovis TaxID=2654633 RepID=A0A8S1EIY0_9PELO|nr:unnamed protein product [Caenorhabditis bovis]